MRRFPQTGYAADGATEAEAALERALQVKQGAFILAPEFLLSGNGFPDLVRFVGGPKLLLPHPKRTTTATRSSSSFTISSTETGGGSSSSSFRGDRRLVRVVIARYLVDRAVRQFEKDASAGVPKE